ncbi:MAG TPA: hypothetical protein DCZ43_02985 [candidate division Zixibacteria bacterium]|nr:hypothetical protein [candidate division Zixibacteria bacterium]
MPRVPPFDPKGRKIEIRLGARHHLLTGRTSRSGIQLLVPENPPIKKYNYTSSPPIGFHALKGCGTRGLALCTPFK